MGYTDALQEELGLGSDATITGNADNLVAGQLQCAINRVILGARSDGNLFIAHRQMAEAAPFMPLPIDGRIGDKTNALMRIAGNIAGVTDVQLTTTSQVAKARAALEAFASARGYPITDTVKLGTGLAAMIPLPAGVPATVGGISTVTLAIGAVGVGVLFAVLRKRARPNPARRRRRRR